LRRKGTHPQRPLRRLRQHREHEVLEVHEISIATKLSIEYAGQQFQYRRETHPGGPLALRQPVCAHNTIITQSCSYNYHLLR
jgi:hypothetical protein